LEVLIAELHDAGRELEAAGARFQSLIGVVPPPPLFDVGPLGRIIEQLQQLDLAMARGQANHNALIGLPAVPKLADDKALASSIECLEVTHEQATRWEQAMSVAAKLHAPPAPQDIQPLKTLLI